MTFPSVDSSSTRCIAAVGVEEGVVGEVLWGGEDAAVGDTLVGFKSCSITAGVCDLEFDVAPESELSSGWLTVGGISLGGATRSTCGAEGLGVRPLLPTRKPRAKNTAQTPTAPKKIKINWRTERLLKAPGGSDLDAIKHYLFVKHQIQNDGQESRLPQLVCVSPAPNLPSRSQGGSWNPWFQASVVR